MAKGAVKSAAKGNRVAQEKYFQFNGQGGCEERSQRKQRQFLNLPLNPLYAQFKSLLKICFPYYSVGLASPILNVSTDLPNLVVSLKFQCGLVSSWLFYLL